MLANLGTERAWIVHGSDGLDELTTTGPNRVSHFHDGKVESYELDPTHYNLKPAHISELLGGEAPVNAHILRGILSGEVDSAKRDVVLLNSGAALVAGGLAPDIASGVQLAAEVLDSGAALAKLDALIAYTQKLAAENVA